MSKPLAEQKRVRRLVREGKALHVPDKKLKPNNVVVFERGLFVAEKPMTRSEAA